MNMYKLPVDAYNRAHKQTISEDVIKDKLVGRKQVFKVPCHLGTANGLQVVVRILDDIGKAESKKSETN